MKMKFKRGIVAGALAMAFAFTSPFWAGCGDGDKQKDTPQHETTTTTKTDKEVASTVIGNAKTTVGSLLATAFAPATAENLSTQVAGLESDMTGIELDNGLFDGSGVRKFNFSYISLMAYHLAYAVGSDSNYTVGSVFEKQATVSATEMGKLTNVNENLGTAAYTGSVKGIVTVDQDNKKVYFECIFSRGDEYNTYFNTTMTYNDNYNVTALETNLTFNVETSRYYQYSAGSQPSDIKTVLISKSNSTYTRYHLGSESAAAKPTEKEYADAIQTKFDALIRKIKQVNVGSLDEAMLAAFQELNTLYGGDIIEETDTRDLSFNNDLNTTLKNAVAYINNKAQTAQTDGVALTGIGDSTINFSDDVWKEFEIKHDESPNESNLILVDKNNQSKLNTTILDSMAPAGIVEFIGILNQLYIDTKTLDVDMHTDGICWKFDMGGDICYLKIKARNDASNSLITNIELNVSIEYRESNWNSAGKQLDIYYFLNITSNSDKSLVTSIENSYYMDYTTSENNHIESVEVRFYKDTNNYLAYNEETAGEDDQTAYANLKQALKTKQASIIEGKWKTNVDKEITDDEAMTATINFNS